MGGNTQAGKNFIKMTFRFFVSGTESILLMIYSPAETKRAYNAIFELTKANL